MSATTPAQPASQELLAELLCFDLYAASRAITGVYRHVLEPLGLTYPQYLVLVLLWQRGSLSVREIIEQLHLDYGTVSPLLKRLESGGFLERNRSPDDERTVAITLTDHGRAIQKKAAGFSGILSEAFGLDENDSARLKRMLGRIRSAAAAETAALAEPAEL